MLRTRAGLAVVCVAALAVLAPALARGDSDPASDFLLIDPAFSASSRNFDLNGEARTVSTKQSSPIIPPA